MADSDFRDSIRNSTIGNILVVLITTALVVGGVFIVNKDGDSDDGGKPAGSQSSQFSEIDVKASKADPPEVGQPAPRFRGVDMDGEPVDLDRIEGPTWLVFNATWCSACRAEVPDIKTAMDERGEDFTLVSVWVNESSDKVEDFIERLDLNYVHVLDYSSEIAGMYRTMGIPAHFFIDADGVVQDIYVGAMSLPQMNDRLDLIIK